MKLYRGILTNKNQHVTRALRKGIHFTCLSPDLCDGCCCVGDGNVYLYKKDILDLVNYLDTTIEKFLENYTKIDHESYFKGIKFIEYPVILFKDGLDKHCALQDASGKCNIFSCRPFQCITGPFLDNFTHSYFSWRDWKKVCPASRAKLNKGKFYSIEEISWGIKQEREIVLEWRNAMIEHDNNYLEYLESL